MGERRIPEIHNGYRIRGVQRRAKAPILLGPIEMKGRGIREMPAANSPRKPGTWVIRGSCGDKGILAIETAFVWTDRESVRGRISYTTALLSLHVHAVGDKFLCSVRFHGIRRVEHSADTSNTKL